MYKKSPRSPNSSKKKSNFVIDKITEDSFYENLLLGFPKFLKDSPFITKTCLERYPPETALEVHYWEYSNGLPLPDDLRNFYLSTNGFSFTYRFQYEKSDVAEEISHVIGGIEINPLQNLNRISNAEITCLTEHGKQYLAPHSKVFALQKIDENHVVVLAQFNPATAPHFWLYAKDINFYFLCTDFCTYFKMALAHVGVPGWQFHVLKMKVPDWSLEILQILAPEVLANFENLQDSKGDSQINYLNTSIFDEADEDDAESGNVRVKVHEKKEKSKKKRSPKSSARTQKNKK